MPEPGARTPASVTTANENQRLIARQDYGMDWGVDRDSLWINDVTRRLRSELRAKEILGFRRGGRVKRTGIYRLHAGERVIPARGRRRGRR